MRTTAADVLDAHNYILPAHLLLLKVCHRAAVRLASLPPIHPLHPLVQHVARRLIKCHKSLLHCLLHSTAISANSLETILPARRHPSYCPVFSRHIDVSKDDATVYAGYLATKEVTVFSDGSCINGSVGMAASLWIKGRRKKTITYHLGHENEHTIFEAELVGVILALHLLRCRKARTADAYIGLDNQAVIHALGDQKPKLGHYLLDKIHDLAKDFQIVEARKQGEGPAGLRLGEGVKLNPNRRFSWHKVKIKRTSRLTITWVPGHVGIEGNETVDAEAKKVAEGHSSELNKLPPFLCRKLLPTSVSANKQAYLGGLKNTWTNKWRQSTRGLKLLRIDRSIPSRKFLNLTASLKRNQTSLLI